MSMSQALALVVGLWLLLGAVTSMSRVERLIVALIATVALRVLVF